MNGTSSGRRALTLVQLNRRDNAIARRDELKAKLARTGWLSTTELARLDNAEALLRDEFGVGR